MVVEVIEVHSEDRHRSVIGRDRFDDIHECGLAVEAPVGVVAAIIRALQFRGDDLDLIEIPFGGESGAIVTFAGRQRR